MNDNQNIYATPAGSNAVNNNNNNDIINITNNWVSPSPRTPQSTNMNSFSNTNFPFPTPPPNLGQRTYDFDGKPEDFKGNTDDYLEPLKGFTQKNIGFHNQF